MSTEELRSSVAVGPQENSCCLKLGKEKGSASSLSAGMSESMGQLEMLPDLTIPVKDARWILEGHSPSCIIMSSRVAHAAVQRMSSEPPMEAWILFGSSESPSACRREIRRAQRKLGVMENLACPMEIEHRHLCGKCQDFVLFHKTTRECLSRL